MTWTEAIIYLFGSWGLGLVFGFVFKYIERFLNGHSF